MMPIGKVHEPSPRGMKAARAMTEALQAVGVTTKVSCDSSEPDVYVYVIGNVPRGRRPTVEKVMDSYSVKWRYAGSRG